MKGFILTVLSLIAINAVLAFVPTTGYSYNPYDLSQTGTMIRQFMTAFSAELASLSLAAIAALGIRMALKNSNMPADMLNGMTVAITLGAFMMIYVTGTYVLFAPAVTYLMLVGIGFLIFNVRKGIEDAGTDLKGWANFVTGLGCFLLAALAMGIEGTYGLGTAGILAIMGIVFLLKGIQELKLGELMKGIGGLKDDGIASMGCPVCHAKLKPDGTCPKCGSTMDERLEGKNLTMDNALETLGELAKRQKEAKEALKKSFDELIGEIEKTDKKKLDPAFYNVAKPAETPADLGDKDFTEPVKDSLDIISTKIYPQLILCIKLFSNQKVVIHAFNLASSTLGKHPNALELYQKSKLMLELIKKESDFFNSIYGNGFTEKIDILKPIPTMTPLQLKKETAATNLRFPGFGGIYSNLIPVNSTIQLNQLGRKEFLNEILGYLGSKSSKTITLLSVIKEFTKKFTIIIEDFINKEDDKKIAVPVPVPAPTDAEIEIETDPKDGVIISEPGGKTWTTPASGKITVKIAPGSYVFTANKAGYTPITKPSITLVAGSTPASSPANKIKFTLAKIATSAQVQIKTSPVLAGVTITLGVTPLGTTSATGEVTITLTTGVHTLKANKPGYDELIITTSNLDPASTPASDPTKNVITITLTLSGTPKPLIKKTVIEKIWKTIRKNTIYTPFMDKTKASRVGITLMDVAFSDITKNQLTTDDFQLKKWTTKWVNTLCNKNAGTAYDFDKVKLLYTPIFICDSTAAGIAGLSKSVVSVSLFGAKPKSAFIYSDKLSVLGVTDPSMDKYRIIALRGDSEIGGMWNKTNSLIESVDLTTLDTKNIIILMFVEDKLPGAAKSPEDGTDYINHLRAFIKTKYPK